jgi:hypothetical protein
LIVANIGWHQPDATSRHMKASRDMRDDLPVIWLTANHQTRSARRARQWHWRDLFRKLASKRMQELQAKAEEREDRTWVVVLLPSARPDFDPEPMLDAVSALISEVNGLEQQSQSGAVQVEGRYPQVVGAAATVAASRPLVLTRCF